MCIYSKDVIINIKGFKFYYQYGWKCTQGNFKGNLKFCFRKKKGIAKNNQHNLFDLHALFYAI